MGVMGVLVVFTHRGYIVIVIILCCSFESAQTAARCEARSEPRDEYLYILDSIFLIHRSLMKQLESSSMSMAAMGEASD